jgi:pre-mRNA-processing factor 8
MSQEALDRKKTKWIAMQNRRFNKKKTVSNPIAIEMPPEHVRKIIKDHGKPESPLSRMHR